MTDTHDAVQAIATVFAELEKHQRQAIRKVRKLRDDYEAINGNGDAGALITMQSFASLDALVTAQYADTLTLHLSQTEVAEQLGIDVGPIAPGEPEEGGEVGILSGSR